MHDKPLFDLARCGCLTLTLAAITSCMTWQPPDESATPAAGASGAASQPTGGGGSDAAGAGGTVQHGGSAGENPASGRGGDASAGRAGASAGGAGAGGTAGAGGSAGTGGAGPGGMAGTGGAGPGGMAGSAGAGGAAGASGTGGTAGTVVQVPADFYRKLEAEQAVIGSTAVIVADALASGGAYVDLRSRGTIEFQVDLEHSGYYDLNVTAVATPGFGHKTNELWVNGVKAASFGTDDVGSRAFYRHTGLWTKFVAGRNTVSIRASWGWIGVDHVELSAVDSDYRDVSSALVNANATTNAHRLMQYLTDEYGRSILAGQQDLVYVDVVRQLTGREPALVGFDLMDASPSRVAHGARSTAAAEAVGWWRDRGGVVTMAWHWNAPSKLYDTAEQPWWSGFYTNATYFDVAAALADPGSQDYRDILRDIDAIAIELQKLEDADVPVLWRPLHEASGGWFWWGAKGPDAYLTLWRLLYDRLTNEHQLDNLIWVWNGQAANWYPGDAYVDIVSEDIYDGKRNYSPQVGRFSQATRYSASPKLVALSENGALVDPDALAASPAAWSWFCTWSGADFIQNEIWNENSMKRAVYAHPYVITLDELPDLKSYPFAP